MPDAVRQQELSEEIGRRFQPHEIFMDRKSMARKDIFLNDVYGIAGDLVEAFSLGFKQDGMTGADGALLRWLDFRLRYIEPVKRKVVRPEKFRKLSVPAEIEDALQILAHRIEHGRDINPHQSKTLFLNDTSGKKRQRRTDGLWADWKIHHFHLSTASPAEGEYFAPRSNWLLFAAVYDNAVVFIDVCSHDASDLWTREELIASLIRLNPDQFERFRIDRFEIIEAQRTSAEARKGLRAAAINTQVKVDGNFYFPPGQGLTATGTSVRASMESIDIVRNARVVEKHFKSPESQICTELAKYGISDPELHLAVASSGLCVLCKDASDIAVGLPREPNDSALAALNNALLPEWAAERLYKYLLAEQAVNSSESTR